MTPLELDILLHYYAGANDYRDGDFSAPAVRASIDKFLKGDMLKAAEWSATSTKSYKLSRKGRYYISYLLSIPEPVEITTFEIPKMSKLCEKQGNY